MTFFSWAAGFFRESSDESMTRLCTLILVIAGVIYAFVHHDYIAGIAICMAGLCPKLVQKRMERKKNQV